MNLSDYVLISIEEFATRRGVMWDAKLSSMTTGATFDFQNDGDGSSTVIYAHRDHHAERDALEAHCETLLGYEGLANAVACLEKGQTLDKGVAEFRAQLDMMFGQ